MIYLVRCLDSNISKSNKKTFTRTTDYCAWTKAFCKIMSETTNKQFKNMKKTDTVSIPLKSLKQKPKQALKTA